MSVVVRATYRRARAIPDAPDELASFIREHWEGLERIAVAHEDENARSGFSVINTIGFERSGHGEAPTGDRGPVLEDEAIEEVMAVVTSDLIAERKTNGRFRAMCYMHKPPNAAKRASGAKHQLIFSARTSARIGSGVTSQLTLDASILARLKDVEDQTLKLADRILKSNEQLANSNGLLVKFIDTQMQRERALLAKQEKDLEERARARAETAEVEADKEIEMARIAQQDRLLDNAEAMVTSALGRRGVEVATKKAKEQAKKKRSGLAGAKKKSKAAEEKTDADDGRTDEEIEELAENHPLLLVAQTLRDGLTQEQRAAIRRTLGDERTDALFKAGDASSDAECVSQLRGALGNLERGQVVALVPLFDGDQMEMMMKLREAAEDE